MHRELYGNSAVSVTSDFLNFSRANLTWKYVIIILHRGVTYDYSCGPSNTDLCSRKLLLIITDVESAYFTANDCLNACGPYSICSGILDVGAVYSCSCIPTASANPTIPNSQCSFAKCNTSLSCFSLTTSACNSTSSTCRCTAPYTFSQFGGAGCIPLPSWEILLLSLFLFNF